MLEITDKAAALDFDVALAEFAKHETWRHVREAQDGDPDFFVQLLMLVMEMV